MGDSGVVDGKKSTKVDVLRRFRSGDRLGSGYADGGGGGGGGGGGNRGISSRPNGWPRRRSYQTIEGMSTDRDGVPWYWSLLAVGAAVLILGGFLTLEATYDKSDGIRVSRSGLGIFAIALLTAGFSFTALLTFAIRNPLFQANTVFLPALLACALGLLTIFYNFLVYERYQWNTPALLTTIASSISTICYSILLIWTHRRVRRLRGSAAGARDMMMSMQRPGSPSTFLHSIGGTEGLSEPERRLWQDPNYYQNYVANMYPTTARSPQLGGPAPGGYDPNNITEDEMQRQQMLMLLLQRDAPPTPDPNSSTFHIDWQGREEEDLALPPPAGGYYAPSGPVQPQEPSPGVQRAWTAQSAQQLAPWDGIWRGVAQSRHSPAQSFNTLDPHERERSRERRDIRRREIEMGGVRRH